jgi:hypothetical protein
MTGFARSKEPNNFCCFRGFEDMHFPMLFSPPVHDCNVVARSGVRIPSTSFLCHLVLYKTKAIHTSDLTHRERSLGPVFGMARL